MKLVIWPLIAISKLLEEYLLDSYQPSCMDSSLPWILFLWYYSKLHIQKKESMQP